MTTENVKFALQLANDSGPKFFQEYLEQTGTDIRLLPVEPAPLMGLLTDMYVTALWKGITMGAAIDKPPQLQGCMRIEPVGEAKTLVFMQGETIIRVPLDESAECYLIESLTKAELTGGQDGEEAE